MQILTGIYFLVVEKYCKRHVYSAFFSGPHFTALALGLDIEIQQINYHIHSDYGEIRISKN